MLLSNLDFAAKLVNGSRGVVVGLSDKGPIVKFDTGHIRELGRQKFFFAAGGVGAIFREQYPLRLAWVGADLCASAPPCKPQLTKS